VCLTLVVVVNFQQAVVYYNRAGRGGVSPEARQVLARNLWSRGTACPEKQY